MGQVIRTVRVDEFEAFQTFLERCYGKEKAFFRVGYPHLYRPTDSAAGCWTVMEKNHEIVGHVGVFPLEIVFGDVRLMTGGIGGVATHPDLRGHGIMSGLMHHVIEVMRDCKWPLSVLWGKRHRYAHFGYETCGFRYSVTVDTDAVSQAEPVRLEEVDLTDKAVVARIRAFYASQPSACRIERPDLDLQLRKQGLRGFMAPEGYILTWKPDRGIAEIVSPNGHEAGMIRAYLALTRLSQTEVEVGHSEGEGAKDRVFALGTGWVTRPIGMFRIVDWVSFLIACLPLLEKRCHGLKPFHIAVGSRWGDQVDTATLTWDEESLVVQSGRMCEQYVELDVRELTAFALGGGPRPKAPLGPLTHLFPVPISISRVDHV